MSSRPGWWEGKRCGRWYRRVVRLNFGSARLFARGGGLARADTAAACGGAVQQQLLLVFDTMEVRGWAGQPPGQGGGSGRRAEWRQWFGLPQG